MAPASLRARGSRCGVLLGAVCFGVLLGVQWMELGVPGSVRARWKGIKEMQEPGFDTRRAEQDPCDAGDETAESLVHELKEVRDGVVRVLGADRRRLHVRSRSTSNPATAQANDAMARRVANLEHTLRSMRTSSLETTGEQHLTTTVRVASREGPTHTGPLSHLRTLTHPHARHQTQPRVCTHRQSEDLLAWSPQKQTKTPLLCRACCARYQTPTT